MILFVMGKEIYFGNDGYVKTGTVWGVMIVIDHGDYGVFYVSFCYGDSICWT